MHSVSANGIAFIAGACSSESRPHANTAFSGERWQHSPTKNCSAGGGAAHGKYLRKNKGWEFVFYRPGPRDPSWGSMLVPWPIQSWIRRIVPMLPRRKQKVAARWGAMRNGQERQNVEPCVLRPDLIGIGLTIWTRDDRVLVNDRIGYKAISRLAAAATLAAIACSAPAGAADEQKLAPLPEVTVTAPRPVTPPAKKFVPYFGNPRVEEDKWPDIPCRDLRVGVAEAGTCKTGTPQETAPGLLPNGPNSNCRIAHDLVMTNLGNLTIEADVMVFDPYYVSGIGHQHKFCAVLTGSGDMREDFADMNQMTRKGNGWRNFRDDGDLSTMEFSVGLSECLAIEKRGPQWGIGRVYIIHASVCRNDRRSVVASDVDYVLGSLRVTTYEPRGNLRPPPQ